MFIRYKNASKNKLNFNLNEKKFTCCATGSKILSMVFVWKTGIFVLFDERASIKNVQIYDVFYDEKLEQQNHTTLSSPLRFLWFMYFSLTNHKLLFLYIFLYNKRKNILFIL